ITTKLQIPYIYKSSYKKANRTSLDSFTGVGDEEALQILKNVSEKFNLSILTDVHTGEEINLAAEVADILQIPAFLSRQTELLVEAGKSGKAISFDSTTQGPAISTNGLFPPIFIPLTSIISIILK
ncbi:MAG: hypothetical protein P8Y81_05590, partial [Ignavibacteriaceae bacterium]